MTTLADICRSGILAAAGGWTAALVIGIFAVHVASAQTPDGITSPDFATEVLPILSARCVKCHGLDAREGGLAIAFTERPAAAK